MLETIERPRSDRHQPNPNAVLTTWRCPTCNNMLAKVALTPGARIEVKCSKCNTYAIREAA